MGVGWGWGNDASTDRSSAKERNTYDEIEKKTPPVRYTVELRQSCDTKSQREVHYFVDKKETRNTARRVQ